MRGPRARLNQGCWMVMSMLAVAATCGCKGEWWEQCSRWGDSDALAGLRSVAPGKLPLYILVSQNEGISRISLERHDLMMEATWSAEMWRVTWKWQSGWNRCQISRRDDARQQAVRHGMPRGTGKSSVGSSRMNRTAQWASQGRLWRRSALRVFVTLPWLFVNSLVSAPPGNRDTTSLPNKWNSFLPMRKKGLIPIEERETFFVTCYKVTLPPERGLTPLVEGSWQGSRTNAWCRAWTRVWQSRNF